MRSAGRETAYVVGPFGAGTRTASELPYGVQHLGRHGWQVTYADPAAAPPPVRRAARLLHRCTRTPVLEPVFELRRVRRADLLVCLLEDNVAVLAPLVRLLRRRPGRRSVLLVVWLADSVRTLTGSERRRWRRRLAAFDDVVVLSTNQVRLLTDALQLPPGLVRAVPFGVAPLTPVCGDVSGVLAVGGDRGRDFPTYLAALHGLAEPVTVLTTAAQRTALQPSSSAAPPGATAVRVTGPVPRAEYLAMLAAARVYVSPTAELAYPTGQTALLEAMQLGKPCVVTRSAALADYVTDGVDALLVPAGDAAALRAAVEALLADADLRAELGAAAARTGARFTEAAMWSAVAAGQRADG